MSNEKLAEALRKIRDADIYQKCCGHPHEGSADDFVAPECCCNYDVEFGQFAQIAEAALQAHAAEAAQPLPQMTDAEHAEILAKYGTPQAAEPVAYALFTEKGLVRMWSRDWFGDPHSAVKHGAVPLYTRPQPAQDAKGCVWSEDEEGNWDTGCGNIFVITDGTPYDNEMGFCCYCGGKLDQVTQSDAAMAKESTHD